MGISATTRVMLCGRVAFEHGGRHVALRDRRIQLVLAYMVRNRTRPVGRSELVELLSIPREPMDPVIAELRAQIGDELMTGDGDLALTLAADAWVDVESAFSHSRRSAVALQRGDWREAAHAARLVLSVTERRFLPGADGPWVQDERRRLEELGLDALECVAVCGLGVGGAQAAVAQRAASALVDAAPSRETGHLLLDRARAALHAYGQTPWAS